MRHVDRDRPLLGLDDATVRFLEVHRLRAIAIPGRSWRDLGDATLLFSSSERDPFFNRLTAVRWPADTRAFDARLREAIEMFGSLERRPYIWITPGATTPADIVDRLAANGFVDQGGGLDMLLVDHAGSPANGCESGRLPERARLEHWHRTPPEKLVSRAESLALVVAEAFQIPATRHRNLVAEIALTLTQPNFHAYLLTIDDEPVATGQRYTFDGASYLSSIGTRPVWRGRGLGKLVTSQLASDSLADNADLIYLAVDVDNKTAIDLYEGLGFARLGPRSADMLAAAPTSPPAR